jgi:hypothetical protein
MPEYLKKVSLISKPSKKDIALMPLYALSLAVDNINVSLILIIYYSS